MLKKKKRFKKGWTQQSLNMGKNSVRRRQDWAGVTIADAFRFGLDYYVRQAAQRLFYETMRKSQRMVARYSGLPDPTHYRPRVEPQISPCYTSYPAILAAYASIGLTAFLEFRNVADGAVLEKHMAAYLSDPAEADEVRYDSEAYSGLVHKVTSSVQSRLFVEDLTRCKELGAVEIYRLYAASLHRHMELKTVGDIITAAVLYSELWPGWAAQEIHPKTRDAMELATSISAPFLSRLKTTSSEQLLLLGTEWVRALSVAMGAEFLNDPSDPRDQEMDVAQMRGLKEADADDVNQLEIKPLNQPAPPSLQESRSIIDQMIEAHQSSRTDQDRDWELLLRHLKQKPAQGPVDEVLKNFQESIKRASSQSKEWEDMRSDLVEMIIKQKMFAEGPLTGAPTQGNEVACRLGDNRTETGELFDRAVEPSDDVEALDGLMSESREIIDTIGRILYPNVIQVPEVVRLRTSGALDPARLPLGEVNSAIFKRYRMHEQPDSRGRALVVIACDGSGSLNQHQMHMLKVLTASWLAATARLEVDVIAALYHSGHIRPGVSGPLVQWIAHPRKGIAGRGIDAVRSILTLPDNGTGAQSDALSLSYIMDEAQAVARGSMIYFIGVTDCCWNQCFETSDSPEDEMASLFSSWNDEIGDRLHTTMVGLGLNEPSELEDYVDAFIPVEDQELLKPEAVAAKLTTYVATCIRERRTFLTR